MKKPWTLLVATTILLLVAPDRVHSLDIDAASGRFGVAIVYNGSGLGTVSPVVNTLGGSIHISFEEGFFLQVQPALDLFWTNYEWNTDQAVPTEYERGQGNNAFVLGFLLDLPLTATARFNERLGGAFSIGPAFLFRAAFANDDTAEYEDEMTANLASMIAYFWSDGRWFYPSAGLRLHVFLQENFTFAFGVRGFMPVAGLWLGAADVFNEGILQVGMSMLVDIE